MSQQRWHHRIRHRAEAGKIRKSSWNVSPPIEHSEPTQFCVSSIHIPSPMRKGVTLAEEGGPTMHSSLQVPRCFFQSEPSPFSVSFCLFFRATDHIGLFLASLQYHTHHFIIHSLIVLFLPIFYQFFLFVCMLNSSFWTFLLFNCFHDYW